VNIRSDQKRLLFIKIKTKVACKVIFRARFKRPSYQTHI